MQNPSHLSNNGSNNSNDKSSVTNTKKGIPRPRLPRIAKKKALMKMKGKEKTPINLSQSSCISGRKVDLSNIYCPFEQGAFRRTFDYQGNGILSLSHVFQKSYQIHSQRIEFIDVINQRINGIRMRFCDLMNQLHYKTNQRLLLNVPLLKNKWKVTLVPQVLMKTIRQHKFNQIRSMLTEFVQYQQSQQQCEVVDNRDVYDAIPMDKRSLYEAKVRLITYMDSNWIDQLMNQFDLKTRGRFDRFQKIQQLIINIPQGRFFDSPSLMPFNTQQIINYLQPFKINKVMSIVIKKMNFTTIEQILQSLIKLFSKDAKSLIELNENENFTQGQIIDSLMNSFGTKLWSL